MQVSLNVSPKISIENHPNYRVVRVSDRQGQVGMLLPHANLVVPDRRAVRSLRDIIQFYEKLSARPPERERGYSNLLSQSTAPVKPIVFNRMDDLPLFAKP
jgi:hypothetical protein